MRLNRIVQLFLAPAKVVSDGSEELETIDHILGELPGMSEQYKAVLKDVNQGKERRTGREGLSAEQIIKLGLLRKRNGMSYRELAHGYV